MKEKGKQALIYGTTLDPTGTGLAIHYNRWRGVEVKEVHDCFEQLTALNTVIKPGDVLWRRSEPYAHSAGKVYGYERIEVTSVHRADRTTQVGYVGPDSSGMVTIGRCDLYALSDVDKLAALVAKHGDKITRLHDPDTEAELASTRKVFEDAWDAAKLPR